ncbi:sensor histidine kinase [Streptomyces sp. SBT349]|uniref:sensor histidine kinase n=1 Tax=Streptomyces sp. SBT349 TaxID=1580539 RepID=UPI000A6404FF|nr:ATP-binding protein [Streptomyces sp. SBT349]
MSEQPRPGRLVCLAVLPAALVAAIAAAALASGPAGPLTAVAAALTGAVLGGAALAAVGEARAATARLTALRRRAARGRVELQALLGKVERGERVKPPEGPPPADPSEDPVDQLRHEIESARHAAESAVFQAVAAAGRVGGGDERVEVFVNLARRMQSFVDRQIEYLDELEGEVEDPDLLKGLFHIDHLATRLRRHAENLAVLGGAVSRRRWIRPVGMSEVLRSCVAEVEHYARVRLVPPAEGTLRGHAVADVVHLLAELVENATGFSAPQSQVLLRARRVRAGIAIEVEDRGLGMTATEESRMNAVLAGTDRPAVTELLDDGRVGLFVVSTLARRHGIAVRLQGNVYGGVQAVLLLPHDLLDPGNAGRHAPYRAIRTAGTEAARVPRPPSPEDPPRVALPHAQRAQLPTSLS